MMAAVDENDAVQFSRDEFLNPEGWVLLNDLMECGRTMFAFWRRGHMTASTCQVANKKTEETRAALIAKINSDG